MLSLTDLFWLISGLTPIAVTMIYFGWFWGR